MATFRQRLRAQLDVLLLLGVVLVATSLGAMRTFALWENTLLAHPEWVSTKAALRRGVMGAVAFTSGRQALAHDRLNLGSWFGFQEVLYADALDLASIEFRFRVEPDGYLHALYDHRPGGFSGLRFSSRADVPSLHYRAAADGEFTASEPLEPTTVSPSAWHRVVLSFGEEDVTVTLDGSDVGVFARVSGPQRMGFRGGQRRAEVDDVILTARDGALRVERFANTRHQGRRLALALGGLLGLVGAVLVAVRRWSSVPLRRVLMGAAVAVALLGVAVAAAYALLTVQAGRYRVSLGEAARFEAYWIDFSRQDIVAGIRSRYAADVPPGVFRLLVLGSSQTWGAGAASEDETWVRQLERLLRERVGGLRVECVNAGVSGLTAAQVLDLLRTDLAGLRASAALVVLSNNDVDPQQFERSLEGLALELRRRRLPAVFALEPNSLERRPKDSRHGDLSAKHDVVRAVAARHQRPVVDLHAYLAAHRDAGFLWWDFVHLTSFGQKLVARKLADELPPLLGLDG